MNNLPKAPKFKNLIGPSFILLGLGLGSGELILWPYLTANWGMGIIWGAILGVTFQFFINMEIERYALARGESVFVGFARKMKVLPFWFIFSTFICWIWPGIIATSARLLGEVIGFTNYNLLGIILLILIGLILTIGKSLYKTVEKISTILIIIGVPAIFLLTMFLTERSDLLDLVRGAINFGFIPDSLPIASFLAAFAFAGAGGNLNLAQSFYVKEKGYGMGKFGGKLTKFEINSENLSKFKKWWRVINMEHLLIFWFGGVLTICLLSLLAYSTVFGLSNLPTGVGFLIQEAIVISTKLGNIIGTSFLIIAGLMLFNTQLTVLDATSRIMTENLQIINNSTNFSKIYYPFLWVQIIFGILIFSFNFGQPLLLLTISAVLNAVTMFVHIGLTLNLNMKELEKEIRPNLFRITMILIAFLFFGYFSIRTIIAIF
ncbi:MAG: hypothetical protein UR39_C0004G0034 [Candidatus Woesebacteria bacterium GW2011_GWA1_33_30]|uniref:Uncharacterized protein n=1 Tax=Candidatus Woesebacteria bacterium GW2011_GWA2_33_28 TaxID=1618561 RepID=A0A0G0A861_9BACT|nr:MAG: hypothetical protein UR38_C0004G0039 [Candidatus Woesebacteria bacterium GW2011_GWA2_33_28]KKP48413.1 MAG: hypothetical protein UR39_C0004G0034 [Candidatus Woesebacteria bacterium GW2011_GWA1_33_30]KKP49520.1 MAG: hypothetical protein UR40_C0005G0034 [Microgenomates group bacterium GW2011_GWC1_33_32]KKP52485.1 MAG: hypothetical protein UR44_C0002G0034 [Candidatus Woesebacteria bacterium GW2011_GWB1_33_38]KKP58343.1 MAG: hypothetical protein UR48_C0005G0021 [Microgenomates group bacteriu